jgi:hypothetical protein
LPTVPTQEFPIPPMIKPIDPTAQRVQDDAAIRAELNRAGRDATPTEIPHVPQFVDGKLQPDD